MAHIPSSDASLFCIIILLVVIKSSHQIIYSCNASESCGCSTNSAMLTKIVGGESAGSETWGWAVSISVVGSYLCDGSILSSSWVITVAHCVDGVTASDITIYAGSNLLWTGSQTRIASHAIVHPNYNSSLLINDIALLRLSSPLIMTDPGISSICLNFPNATVLAAGEWPPVNTTVVAVGWGKLSENGSVPQHLQQVTLQTVDWQASTCSPLLHNWEIQLCAGVPGGGKDACQGDSGGPLMMFTSTYQWILVGLTSSGYGCARAAYSGVYTRVPAYERWINTTMNDLYSNSGSSFMSNSQILINYLVFFVYDIALLL